jgi:hypothetical protein
VPRLRPKLPFLSPIKEQEATTAKKPPKPQKLEKPRVLRKKKDVTSKYS